MIERMLFIILHERNGVLSKYSNRYVSDAVYKIWELQLNKNKPTRRLIICEIIYIYLKDSKEKKEMEVKKYTKKELVRDLCELTQFTQKDVSYVTDAFTSVLREALVSGHEVSLRGVGTFKLQHVAPQPARENQILDPRNPEVRGTRPATPGHYRIHFKVAPTLKNEIKANTLGK